MFEIGKEYSRGKDIHDVYGGTRQAGISPLPDHPYIFIFSGSTGEAYGYEDGWQAEEGVFLYSGQGQVGDMEFKRGNRAIRDHVQDGKQLLVFEALGHGKPVRYLGEFVCSSYDFGKGPDRDGALRRTIRFHLVPVQEASTSAYSTDEVESVELSLAKLRTRALEAVPPTQASNWRDARVRQRKRNRSIKDYVLRRANGVCELTGERAPFLSTDGTPFLEVHHIHQLSDGGLDHPSNCAAITPNAHREIHFGECGKALDDQLLEIILRKEERAAQDIAE